MSWKDSRKAELVALAEAQGVSSEGNRADIIAALEAAGYEPKAESEPEAEPKKSKRVAAARESVNTWWCGKCDHGNQQGVVPPGEPAYCANCGTERT